MTQDANIEIEALLREARKRLGAAEDGVAGATTEEERFFLELELERCDQVVEDLENYAQAWREPAPGPNSQAAEAA